MSTPHIDIPFDIISVFCKRWEVKELALFGSVLPGSSREQ